MYLIAMICPPLAVLICGKPVQAVLNLFLCLLLWLPGIIHAFAVVKEHNSNKRVEKLIKGMGK